MKVINTDKIQRFLQAALDVEVSTEEKKSYGEPKQVVPDTADRFKIFDFTGTTITVTSSVYAHSVKFKLEVDEAIPEGWHVNDWIDVEKVTGDVLSHIPGVTNVPKSSKKSVDTGSSTKGMSPSVGQRFTN